MKKYSRDENTLIEIPRSAGPVAQQEGFIYKQREGRRRKSREVLGHTHRGSEYMRE
jgi:hypothetical protein